MSKHDLPANQQAALLDGKPVSLFAEIRNVKKRAFLTAFSQCGRIVKSCQQANVHWKSHYLWLKQDKAYAEAFEQAKQIAADRFEDEIYRRGFEGYDKPVTYQGAITNHYTDYSDTLAIFALKGLRPDKYKDGVQVNTLGPTQLAIIYPGAVRKKG